MLFNSFQFLVFFPLVVLAYFVCPHRYRWAVLLGASYYFYAAWSPEYVVLLFASTLIDYVSAIQIARTQVKARRKAFLALSLASNLGLLFGFKYLHFFNDSLRVLLNSFNIFYDVLVFEALLPVGISFYTFQTLSYTLDVYRGKIEPERHLGLFSLYVSFFPQLAAGPIERADHLLPQFRLEHSFSASRASDGLRRMLWGMFKKVVIADRLAIYVNGVYGNAANHRGLPVILATYFMAIQIYCDFSGYTDMALGAAKAMGYDLTENFRRPYASSSVTEFWRRWHISLTAWFRDYVYIPLGGNRVPRWRWTLNIMTVFVASGLWHGANWTFVLWGGLHGLYYLVEEWSKGIRAKIAGVFHLTERPAVRAAIGTFVAFHLVCFGWVFFRASSVSDAFLLVSNLTQIGASTDIHLPWKGAVGNPDLETAVALGLVALLAVVQFAGRQKPQVLSAFKDRAWVRWAAYLLLALAILNLGISKEAGFIYFQF